VKDLLLVEISKIFKEKIGFWDEKVEVKAQMGKVLLIVLCQLGVFPPISNAVPGGKRVNL